MAKGNMLLGFSRGKVGDLVFKRLNGQQITVPRVRDPKNPRSGSQTIQRIAFASASKTAQSLRGIVDHSFQGVRYGSQSVNKFVSQLAKEIKAYMMSSLASPSTAPYGTAPILPYQAAGVGAAAQAVISSGDLRSIPFTMGGDSVNGAMLVGVSISAGTDLSTMTLADFETLMGVPATDQVTLVCGSVATLDYISETELFYGINYNWLRFNIREDAADTAPLFVAASGGWFTINTAIIDDSRSDAEAMLIRYKSAADYESPLIVDASMAMGKEEPIDIVLAGIIVSRFEGGVWRRNTCRLARTGITVTPSAAGYAAELGLNDVRDVLELSAPAADAQEEEYLNKEKKK